jgi:hypothetical protein
MNAIRTIVVPHEVDLEIHPALDLAQRWRAQGMKIE